MRKIIVILAMLVTTVAAHAQFEQGKKYLVGTLNSIGMSYNGSEEFRFGLSAGGGYFFRDNWLLKAELEFAHRQRNVNAFGFGAGVRYYVLQNGLFGGASLNGVFANNRNDFVPKVEIGYCFFLNDKLAVEPAVYYEQSTSDHSEYSTVGLKIGVGFYMP